MFNLFDKPPKPRKPEPLWSTLPIGWQKCPKCDGEGQIRIPHTGFNECPICKGQMIISIVNGKPPAGGKITDKDIEWAKEIIAVREREKNGE